MPRPGFPRLIGLTLSVLAAVLGTVPVAAGAAEGAAAAGPAQAGPAQIGPAQIGPAQINAPGRPDLCWQVSGNGSPVTLAHCDGSLQNQQWALSGNGVLMNGIGYCLEAGTGTTLFIGFDGQCGGASDRQLWRFNGTAGQLASRGPAGCAVPGGPLVPGTEIVSGACPGSRWSFGYSAVSLAAGTGGGTAGGPFTASVTVANAASAQAAYGVSVRLTVPRGLTVTALRGGAGWACQAATLTCSGSLAAGGSVRIGVTGRLPAGARTGTAYTVSAVASARGTSPQPGTAPGRATVRIPVRAAAAATGPGTGGQGAMGQGAGSQGGLPLAALLAGLLLAGGGVLIFFGRRSRRRTQEAVDPRPTEPFDVTSIR